MRRSIGGFNIQEAPCGLKLLKIGMLKFLFRAQNYFQMPSPSGGIDGEFFFCKRWNQRPRLSTHLPSFKN